MAEEIVAILILPIARRRRHAIPRHIGLKARLLRRKFQGLIRFIIAAAAMLTPPFPARRLQDACKSVHENTYVI